MRRDRVLTIESPSRATLRRAADGLDSEKVERVIEMKRSSILKDSWDRVDADRDYLVTEAT